MTQRFQKATDALYQAFFNGTLAKGNCYACAVGNIVAAAMDCKIMKNHNGVLISFSDTTFWSDLFLTNSKGQKFWFDKGIDPANASSLKERLFSLTGYTVYEMARVEFVFEITTRIKGSDYSDHTEQEILEDQYKGLCAVFDVLMKLDEVEDIQYKEKLKTHPELQLV